MLAALRAGLALLLLLAVASGCGGPRRQTATATPTPSAPSQSLAPFVTTESLAVGPLYYDIPVGNSVAWPEEGCLAFETILWSDREPQPLHEAAYLAVVGQLREAGYGAAVLGSDDAATFTLRAAVGSASFGVCFDDQGATSLNGVVRTEWELFSELQQTTVLQRRTVRQVTGVFHGEQALESAIAVGVADGAGELAADAAFQRALLLTPEEAAAAAAPPPELAIPRLPRFNGRFSAVAVKAQAATVLVVSGGHGSGVIISESGLILTNHHVVGDAARVRVELADGRKLVARVLVRDADVDVALLAVEGEGLTALPLSLALPGVGEEVYAIGAPLETAFTGTVTKGIVSAIRAVDTRTVIQADVDVQQGNSGGPLTDAAGNVVALTFLGIQPEATSIGINFFIPIAEALAAVGVTLR